MSNILEQLELQNRFIFETQLPESPDFYIDYDTVNEKLEILRKDSISYLSDALNSVERKDIENIGGIV